MTLRRPTRRQRRIVILALAFLTFGIAYYGGNKYSSGPLPKISGIYLKPPIETPEFDLKFVDGRAFANENLADNWSLLVLDPAGLKETYFSLARVHNQLATTPELYRELQFYYLLDPNEQLEDPIVTPPKSRLHMLEGQEAAVLEVFERFGIDVDENQYSYFLIDPDGRMLALFSGQQEPASIASDIRIIMEQ